MNMTISDLKRIIENLPDDMPVIMAKIDDGGNNLIAGLYHVRTAGVLTSPYEPDEVLGLNTSEDGVDIRSQLQRDCGTTATCTKVLF